MLNVKKVNGIDLLRRIKNNEEFQLLTIADNSEYFPQNIHFKSVTFSEIEKNINLVRKDIPVIIACNEGEKSYFLAAFIMRHNIENVYSLEGGLKNLKSISEGKN